MPLNPTDVLAQESLHEFKGLNDQQDSLSRPKGTVRTDQNVYDEQISDANRRHGRTFDRLESAAVNFLFQFTWEDAGVNFGYVTGSNGKNDPLVYPGGLTQSNTFGPMPTIFATLPIFRNESNLPDFTSYIRALSDARRFVNSGSDSLSYPSQIWAFDVYEVVKNPPHTIPPDVNKLVGINVRDKASILFYINKGFKLRPTLAYPVVTVPVPHTNIPDDFYFADYVAQPALILSHLTTLVTRYNTVLLSYVKTNPITNAASIVNWDGTDQYVPGTITFDKNSLAYWETVADQLARLIDERLKTVQSIGSFDQYSIKQDSTGGSTADASTEAQASACVIANHASHAYGPDNAAGTSDQYTAIACSQFASDPVGSEVQAHVSFYTKAKTASFSDLCNVVNNRAKIVFSLSSFNYGTGSVSAFLKLKNPSGGGGVVGILGQITPIAVSDFGLYGVWGSAGQIPLGSDTTTPYVTGSDVDPTNFVSPFPASGAILGWICQDASAIISRDYLFLATPPRSNGFPLLQVPAYETFGIVGPQTVNTSETDIMFSTVNRTNTGAADPSYPVGSDFSSTQRQPASFTPSQFIQFSKDSLGFSPSKFNGMTYRPTITGDINLGSSVLSGAPTIMTIRFYINGILKESYSANQFGGSGTFAFSIKDIGDFTTFRPPDNNSSDNLNGWPTPAIRITAQVNAGSVSVISCNVRDFVVDYPV